MKRTNWDILGTEIIREGSLRDFEERLARTRARYSTVPGVQVRTFGRVVRAGGAAVPVTVVVVRKPKMKSGT